ncbi:hypothetical protein M427DRAFT_31062 [Gonapodya prolifera JEL478]|uniref:catechol O-methyltransferase n=1 Tax=Gonapodya prolifera (strain JEL478) TaxID=1344416 RepID=A0A139AIM9_GONPJ|nr:hypothetical protein M427DRAFT_31062 [Gonapodya prolifera JEL478]|eukprot:KXS16656.1 hypothetical protein M427DRAFT_31062 [Gonapodya prolifera JEL478]
MEDPSKSRVHEVTHEQVKLQATPGNAQSVVDVMDKLGWDNHWHMSLGDEKAVLIRKVIRDSKPRTLLELGTYIGYSVTVIGSEMTQSLFSSRWTSTRQHLPSPKRLRPLRLASPTGHSVVELLVGDCLKIILTLKERFPNGFDVVFIDSWKDVYLPSLKLLEEHGLLHTGSIEELAGRVKIAFSHILLDWNKDTSSPAAKIDTATHHEVASALFASSVGKELAFILLFAIFL